MRKFTLLISFILFFYNSYAKRLEGYYINNDSEKIEVIFDIPILVGTLEPNLVNLQRWVNYYDGKTRLKLEPEQAKILAFFYNGIKYKMVSIIDVIGKVHLFSKGKRVFLHIVIEGKLNLYKAYKLESPFSGALGSVTSQLEHKFIFQKCGEKLYAPRRLWFKKDMSEYLSDCPDYAYKIQKRQNRRSDEEFSEIEYIVMDYNKQCQ